MATKTVSISPSLVELCVSFQRSLEAENKSSRTALAYIESLRIFDRYAAHNGTPRDVANVRREHVEAFMTYVLAR